MKNKKIIVPTRPVPNVTRAQKDGVTERGELDPYREDVAAQQSVHPTNAPALNYAYIKGVGHYKDCPVCIGECICG